MPTDNSPVDATKIDEAILRAHVALEANDPASPEYQKTLDQTIKLYKLRQDVTPEPEPVPEPVIDKDRVRFKDWIPVIGSVGAVLVIVAFEAAGHGVTSKALGFVSKLK